MMSSLSLQEFKHSLGNRLSKRDSSFLDGWLEEVNFLILSRAEIP